MGIIECKDITISYEGKPVISDVSFSVNPGDYLCIVGENGSGKTTLMKALLGLKKTDKGEIIYNEKSGTRGYLPQQIFIQRDFPASVYEIVLSGCLNSGKKLFYSKADKDRAIQNMERLEISRLKNTSYMELSGGQQQRVLLARALCATKDILFLDEPVAGLDPLVTNEMYELIKDLNKEGITIVMISHDIEMALEYSSKILHLGNRVEFFGATDDYRKTELCEHYLCHIAEHLHHDKSCGICNRNVKDCHNHNCEEEDN